MNILARNNLMAQFAFDPTVGGMTLPDITEDAARLLSPDHPADAHVFAETNRTLRREAAYGPVSPRIRFHNEAKTVLGAPETPYLKVESLFQYLGDDGFIDRSVDLRQDRDLRTSNYCAQTLVAHKILSDGDFFHSSVTKSLSVAKHPVEGDSFKDKYYRIHLTGETLRKISAHPHFNFLDYDLGALAASFSAFVYFSESFEDADIVGDGLYYLDPQGRPVRMLHPDTRDFNEAFGLIYRNLPMPDRITVTSQPPNRRLEMTFSSMQWFGQKETLIDVHVASTPGNRKLVLRNGLRDLVRVLLGLANPVPAS